MFSPGESDPSWQIFFQWGWTHQLETFHLDIPTWFCWWSRNPANQLIWEISHHLQGFMTCQVVVFLGFLPYQQFNDGFLLGASHTQTCQAQLCNVADELSCRAAGWATESCVRRHGSVVGGFLPPRGEWIGWCSWVCEEWPFWLK